jgi:hypothetical protein
MRDHDKEEDYSGEEWGVFENSEPEEEAPMPWDEGDSGVEEENPAIGDEDDFGECSFDAQEMGDDPTESWQEEIFDDAQEEMDTADSWEEGTYTDEAFDEEVLGSGPYTPGINGVFSVFTKTAEIGYKVIRDAIKKKIREAKEERREE